MDQYFQQMAKIVGEKKTSSRVRFMLQDVIDLRKVSQHYKIDLRKLSITKYCKTRAHPAISHCSQFLLKCRVATNICHWLKVQSRWFKNYIILDFQILLLLFLHTLLLCHILLSGCWIFSIPSRCQTVWIQIRPTRCRGWSGSKLFAKVISRQQNVWLDLGSNCLQTTKVGKKLNTKNVLILLSG